MLFKFFLLVSITFAGIFCLEHPIIETNNGRVRGNTKNITDG